MKKFCVLSYILIIFIFTPPPAFAQEKINNGADRLELFLPLLKNKKVALVVNQTSILKNGTHLLDALITNNVSICKIFAPEHGFRGDADAGEKIVDGKDSKTGIPVISLYGKNNKPTPSQLADVNVIIFDIQDVGARFYTYISTMHYVMEACAENSIKCIILDRPNPNDYIDGPVLDLKYKSFVGMHKIPILHGLTVGELAQMINGERWLVNAQICDLTVIPLEGWKHGQPYILPVKPSPNLPNSQAVKLYPSLCFFEATKISVGRGTDFPFQIVGGPDSKYGVYTFTPRSMQGAKNPLLKDMKCYGYDLRKTEFSGGLSLKYLLDFYKKSGQGAAFFSSPRFMDLLSGSNKLRTQIIDGMTEEQIRETWQKDLEEYKTIRQKYLLYR